MYSTVYAIHDVDSNSDRYAEIKHYMLANGSPKIRVVDCADHYVALEGSHRLAIAAELGLAPDFDILDQDELLPASAFDWTEALCQDEQYPAGELAGEAFSTQAVPYTIEQDGTLRA